MPRSRLHRGGCKTPQLWAKTRRTTQVPNPADLCLRLGLRGLHAVCVNFTQRKLEQKLKAIIANPALFAEDPMRKELPKRL